MSGTSSVINSIGRTIYQLGFQISPIVLNNGIASSIGGAMLPIVALTEAASFANGLLQGDVSDSLDSFFAHFRPTGGGTLIDFAIASYPFANQQVAANAIIAMPLKISLAMVTPAQQAGGIVSKFITFLALQQTLKQHSLLGGTYTVVTPAFLYENCILKLLRDTTGMNEQQAQSRWQFDFEQPLVTQQAAQAAQNALTSQITNQTPISGQPANSGAIAAAGSPSSAPGFSAGASNLTGTSVGGNTPQVASGVGQG